MSVHFPPRQPPANVNGIMDGPGLHTVPHLAAAAEGVDMIEDRDEFLLHAWRQEVAFHLENLDKQFNQVEAQLHQERMRPGGLLADQGRAITRLHLQLLPELPRQVIIRLQTRRKTQVSWKPPAPWLAE